MPVLFIIVIIVIVSLCSLQKLEKYKYVSIHLPSAQKSYLELESDKSCVSQWGIASMVLVSMVSMAYTYFDAYGAIAACHILK